METQTPQDRHDLHARVLLDCLKLEKAHGLNISQQRCHLWLNALLYVFHRVAEVSLPHSHILVWLEEKL